MSTANVSPLDVLDAYRSAVWAKDVDAFVELYAADLHVFDAWDRWASDREGWRVMAESWFAALGEERVEVQFGHVRVEAREGIAAVWADVRYTGISAEGERLRSVLNRYSAVLVWAASHWRIKHEHTSVPVDFASGRAIAHKDATPGG